MIIPKSRLLVFTAGLFIPPAFWMIFDPQIFWLVVLLASLFVAVSITDAWQGYLRLRDLLIFSRDKLRISKGQSGEVQLEITGRRKQFRQVKIALFLPVGLASAMPETNMNLSGENNYFVKWPVEGLAIGRFELRACLLQICSPLGLWRLGSIRKIQAVVHVYPNIFQELKQALAYSLRDAPGMHVQRLVGKGREFDQLREYQPGDSYEDIHWKATARFGRPICKVFQYERTQEIYFLVDASRLSIRKVPALEIKSQTGAIGHGWEVSVLERYITAALAMCVKAQEQGDFFGVSAFSDHVQAFVRAGSGKAQYRACREALFQIQAQSTNPDYNQLFTFLASRLNKRALLVFFTSLDDPMLAESFAVNLNVLSKNHLLLVNTMKPHGAERLFSPAAVESVKDIYARLAGHYVWEQLQETGKKMERLGVGFLQMENERMCVQLISQYLNVKQRQLL